MKALPTTLALCACFLALPSAAARADSLAQASFSTFGFPSARVTLEPGDEAAAQTVPSGSSLRAAIAVGTAQLAVQYAALSLMNPPNWESHGNSVRPSWRKFRSNFTRLPVWSPRDMGGGGVRGWLQADGDHWTTNVVGHGLQGSEMHLRMRTAGYSVPVALLAGVIQSTVWEYLVEGWNETPSLWDLVYTPLAGVAIGEMRYHAVESLEGPAQDGGVARGLLFAVDPISFTF
ncbi:DUF3943 domain-containing protein [Haliangium ochraceum]|uniref:DUF3943 domain-containing protein n=1 Tax=Haliangium ochraceum (strain DSM 14365 / JCM 11303 / SMP-2) TaxID=502025 RepID=D0LKG4_HALO1|nr:DUF3943 domain-containing protein [Haliangium ochraceum]ACY15012.1 hypothetical protein Hoch_2476 [Haliangium ochraceum DSM 14365]